MEQIQGRRGLDDEIEKAFLRTAEISIDILTFAHTDRNYTPLQLYEGFFKVFGLLVFLTCIYPQMRKSEDVIGKALRWIETKPAGDTSKQLLPHCIAGVTIFREYASRLADQGVMAPPVRG